MTSKNISKNLQIVKTMPPLKHTAPGQPFDITKSEVVKWLVRQPEVLQWIFDHINNMQRSGTGEGLLIKFDSDTGTWRGTNYEGGDDA